MIRKWQSVYQVDYEKSSSRQLLLIAISCEIKVEVSGSILKNFLTFYERTPTGERLSSEYLKFKAYSVRNEFVNLKFSANVQCMNDSKIGKQIIRICEYRVRLD